MPSIIQAATAAEILACRDVVFLLRPHLKNEQAYLQQVQQMMREDGYRLIFIPHPEKGGSQAVAFAGYRYMNKLLTGKAIYIDDLATLPAHRGKGYASQLLQYIQEEAVREDVNVIQLDSGYERTDAHRLYLNQGYRMQAHHFICRLRTGICQR
jgi:GNAT superfamily N-acetyltransferase